jgi:hypothetical protein
LCHQRKSKEVKKKKESGDSFVNVYLRWLACLSQLLLEALLIADLRNELNTHLTPLEFSWA